MILFLFLPLSKSVIYFQFYESFTGSNPDVFPVKVKRYWGLGTDRGRATLKLALDPDTGAVTEAALQVARRLPPDDAW